jgi:hypothetical protein
VNIRKGFFGLTLILSILLGTIPPLCHKWYFEESQVDINLPENWKEMPYQAKWNNLDGLLSKNATFPLISKIKQLSIRRQFKKMVVGKQDEVLREGFGYSFGFRFYVGWKELGLLGLVGFVSVWIMYGFVRGVPFLIPHLTIIHFPSVRLDRRVESLNFPSWCEPAGLGSRFRITIFGLLALEEGTKRPRKPRAVWKD